MFGGQQQSNATGSSLFGGANTTTQPSGTSNLFGTSTAGAGTGTGTTQGTTGGGLGGSTLFGGGAPTAQTQAKPPFSGLGGLGSGLSGAGTGGVL